MRPRPRVSQWKELWKAQKQSYRDEAVWEKVPHKASCNNWLAKIYARLIVAFHQDSDVRLVVVEVGAGHGRFGFLVVTELLDMGFHNFIYVLTDFCNDVINKWVENAQLMKLVREGWMDFAVFDADTSTDLFLQCRNMKIHVDHLVVIMNYVIDSLCQDVFEFEEENVYEVSAQFGKDTSWNDTDEWEWKRRPIKDISSYYRGYAHSAALQSLLHTYKDVAANHSVILPVGAIIALCNLLEIAQGNCMTLAGDKGDMEVCAFPTCGVVPHVSSHHSVSFTANFHSLQLVFESRFQNCQVLKSLESDVFNCMCLISRKCTDVSLEWRDTLGEVAADSFLHFQSVLGPDSVALTSVLALLRLSNFDSDIFLLVCNRLLQHSPFVNGGILNDMVADLVRVSQRYFFMANKDVMFELGRVMMGLKEYRHALNFLSQSRNEEHFIAIFNMGVCKFHQRHFEESVVLFEEAFLASNEKYTQALRWSKRAKLLCK